MIWLSLAASRISEVSVLAIPVTPLTNTLR